MPNSIRSVIKRSALRDESPPKEKSMATTFFCPRCDRAYERETKETAKIFMKRVVNHVSQQHPDHDPDWWDTFDGQ